MNEDQRVQKREPIFNVPASVLVVLAILAAVHAGRWLLTTEQDNWVVLALAFIPARFAGYAAELPGGNIAEVTSFVTHMMVHGDITHLLFNCAWLLAFGAAVAERTGGFRFLMFFAFCGIAGAATFLVFNQGLLSPMIGASGAVAGLMGASMRFLFNAMDNGGFWRLREAPRSVPLAPLAQTIRDRRVLLTTAIWLGLNGLALLGLGGVEAGGAIAWEAHIGGYAAGLLTFGFFDRPALTHSPDFRTLH